MSTQTLTQEINFTVRRKDHLVFNQRPIDSPKKPPRSLCLVFLRPHWAEESRGPINNDMQFRKR